MHIALPAAAIHVQGDDGTALVFLGIGLVMLYAGGLSHWLVAGGLTAGVVGGAALLTLRPGILKGYQFKRILAVLTPDDPALADITYQQNKGAMAIGTGGLTGQGLLSGEHIFVPNAWNDFIFAYLANVLGFLGAAAVLLLLFALCLRTLRTGSAMPRRAGLQYLRRHLCGAVFAVCDKHRHEFAGAAGHRRDAAVLLGRRVKRRHDVSLRRHCAQRRHEHPPQQAGNAADFMKKAGTVRFSLLLSWPPLRG